MAGPSTHKACLVMGCVLHGKAMSIGGPADRELASHVHGEANMAVPLEVLPFTSHMKHRSHGQFLPFQFRRIY